MTVFIHDDRDVGSNNRIGYAYRDATGSWIEGLTPTLATDGVTWYDAHTFADPSVAYDAAGQTETADGGFLCAALARKGAGSALHKLVLVSRYDPGSGMWSDWLELKEGASGVPTQVDKPFLVAGGDDEFYVVWSNGQGGMGGEGYGCSRTVNGGLAWVATDPIVDVDTSVTVTGLFAMQPSVFGNRDLYVAYHAEQDKFRFLRGTDDNSGPSGNNGVVFRHLRGPGTPLGPAVEVPIDASFFQSLPTYLPGVTAGGSTMQIAVDPTNIRRLYVAYHDEHPNQAGNSEVYVRTLDARGFDWFLGPEKLVYWPSEPSSGCPEDEHTDQFLPMITVDGEGRVHVLYLDDGGICQDDSVGNTARFNVTYAVSCDGAQTFFNITLGPAPGSPNAAYVDFFWETDGWNPREYNGFTFVEGLFGGTTVWATFGGMDQNDPDSGPPPGNKSVIYAIPFGY